MLRKRPLVDEPLTKEDWSIVYAMMVGFQASVETVVKNARRRAASQESAQEEV